jgi:hypothetical protein
MGLRGHFDGDYRRPALEIHAFLAVGDDGEEGIITMSSPNGPLPLIATDRVRLDQVATVAAMLARSHGMSIEHVKFTTREHVAWISPNT